MLTINSVFNRLMLLQAPSNGVGWGYWDSASELVLGGMSESSPTVQIALACALEMGAYSVAEHTEVLPTEEVLCDSFASLDPFQHA
jgi:hypothetical protein